MSAGTARRGSNFDLLRLAAASAVVFSHSQLVVAGEGWWVAHSTSAFPQFGDDAVAVFFVISGMLVTQSWLRDPHLVRYLTRRVLRVMPALVVTVAASCLVLGVIASELTPSAYLAAPGTWAYLVNTTLFFQMFNLPGVFTHLPLPCAINGSLWTLRYEFICYLAVPVLVAVVTVVRRRGAVLIIGATCAAIATLALTAHVDYVIAGADPFTIAGLPGAAGWNLAPLFVLLTYFLAGMSIEMWQSRIRFDARVARGAGLPRVFAVPAAVSAQRRGACIRGRVLWAAGTSDVRRARRPRRCVVWSLRLGLRGRAVHRARARTRPVPLARVRDRATRNVGHRVCLLAMHRAAGVAPQAASAVARRGSGAPSRGERRACRLTPRSGDATQRLVSWSASTGK